MSGRGLLDADMHAVGGWIADGARWWIRELAGLVPPGWRERRHAATAQLRFDPPTGFRRLDARGLEIAGAPPIGRPVAVTLPPDLCLRRTITRPVANERDLARMLTLDQDRIMPLPSEAILVAGRIVGVDAAAERATVVVAGFPLDRATAFARAVADAGIVPVRVLAPGPEGPVDLLPVLAERGLLARSRGAAARWWAAVAFLFMFNIGLVVWRDAAATEQVAALVEAQQPAVDVAHGISRRIEASDRIARQVAAMRGAREPLAVLARLSGALPENAWVQRLSWQGDSVKLAGYRGKDSDVAAALRRRGGFANVRYADGAPAAADANGQPFELVAALRGR